MAENPTIQEFPTTDVIQAHEVDAAVDAAMSNPGVRAYPIGRVFELDLAAAITASRVATMILRDVHATETHKRTALRTAILLARPEKVHR